MALCLVVIGCGSSVGPPNAVRSGQEPRLISLSPNLTEIAFAIGAGDLLVGRTDVCDWPPEAGGIDVIGRFGRPSLEAILTRRPTVVFSAALEDRGSLAPLETYGIAQEIITCQSLDDIPEAMRKLGKLAGRAEQGEREAAAFEDKLAALRMESTRRTARPTLFIEIWSTPLMTVGGRSFISEMAGLAGFSNIAAVVDSDYFTVTPEWVLRHDPEFIYCLYGDQNGNVQQNLAQRPGWSVLKAIRHGRVFSDFNPDSIFRPGPRVFEGVAELRKHHPASD